MQGRTDRDLREDIKRFRILCDLANEMNAEQKLEKNLQMVVEKSRELLGAHASFLALRDEAQPYVYIHSFSGLASTTFRHIRLPFGAGSGRLAGRTRSGSIVENYPEEKAAGLPARFIAEEGMISGMNVPVEGDSDRLGFLCVFNRSRSIFSPSDLHTLSLLGKMAAIEIERRRSDPFAEHGPMDLVQKLKETDSELSKLSRLLKHEKRLRKRSTQAWKESERRYRELVDSLPEVVFEADDRGRLLYVNRNALTVFGYTKEDLEKGLNIFQMIVPEDMEKAREHVKRILKGDHVGGIDYRAERKDGTAFPVVVQATIFTRPEMNPGIRGFLADMTREKETREIIRERDERIRTIIEHSNELFYVQDTKHRFTYVSPQCKTILGYTTEEMIGERMELVADNPINKEGIQITEDAIRSGERQPPYLMESRRKDGKLLLLEIDESPLKDQKGKVVGIVGAARDVTERKRSEEALRAAERKYRSIFENAIEGMYQTTLRGAFISVNPAFAKIYGYDSPDELIATLRDTRTQLYVDPDRRKELLRILREQSKVRNFESEFYRKDGTIAVVSNNARRVEDESGNLLYLEGFVEDVTERKKAEQALQESEQRYRDLFDNVFDFIYFHDLEGRFIETNLAFKRAYGTPEEPCSPSNVRDMMPEKNLPHFEEYIKRIIATGRDEGLLKVLTKDGREIIVEYKNALVHDPKGNPVGVRGSARDVTDRVRAEAEKKRLQVQILRAQRIEAIGTLAGGIAHNFNNLLMGIQGNATLARLEAGNGGAVCRKLENIEKLVKSGAKLTAQLLGYARGGRYEIKPMNLNDLVKDISNTFAQARKDIIVQLDLSDLMKDIEAEQGQMEQVLLNLLVNAADAMPKGGKVIVRTRNVSHSEMTDKAYKPKPGKYVLLEVTDTGAGMDQKTIARIFEPFFTTKGMGKGTGLGLASVYGIVKGHCGYIDVSSQEGKGSTFLIYLPATEKKVMNEKELPMGILSGSGTVLIVDDEEMILEVGRGMLEKLGYKVLTAETGKQAVETYMKNPADIDLVVLDLVMPDMSGRETYDHLRKVNPGLRVLLSSGFSMDSVAKEMLDHGCGGFIQKPFLIQELSQELSKVLERGH